MKQALSCVALLLLALLIGCAIDITQHSQRIPLVKPDNLEESVVLQQDVQLDLPGGLFIRKLERGSTWQAVGDLPQGRVYRSVNRVLMVGSGNAHEAHIVLGQGAVIGVYLPVEGALITAEKPVLLTTGRTP